MERTFESAPLEQTTVSTSERGARDGEFNLLLQDKAFVAKLREIIKKYRTADAEDILNLSLTKAHEHLDQCKGNMKAWLRTIVTRTAINSYNKEKSENAKIKRPSKNEEGEERNPIDTISGSESDSPEIQTERKEQKDRVWEAVGYLPKPEQNVIRDVYIEDLTQSEVAAKYGISIDAANSRIHLAPELTEQGNKSRKGRRKKETTAPEAESEAA